MVSGREQFLTAQVEPGKANEPCRYAYIFPARIALSSEQTPPFQQAGFLAAVKDLPLKTVGPYRYTLRRLRLGYLYHIEKAGGELKEVECDERGDTGDTDKKPWFRIDTTIQELYIAFSDWKWDEAFQKKVAKAPEDHMQKVTLKAGQPYVGSAGQIGELVEEFRTEPGKLVSLRGFPDARKVCDSEDIYAEYETYAPKTSEDWRFLTRRWRDGGYEALTWTPLEKNAIPEVPCPTAQAENRVFLLAVHDSVGIAREFAALQGASVATLSSRNDWLAYQHTMAVYAKTLLAVQPSYAEHLQQDYSHIVEEKYLGLCSLFNITQPSKAMQKKIREPGPDEKRTFELRDRGLPGFLILCWYGVIRRKRFSGSSKKNKAFPYPHYGPYIGPRGAGHKDPDDWSFSPKPLPKYPGGIVSSGEVYPTWDKTGEECWRELFIEHVPAKWSPGAIDEFLATVKKDSDRLSREFKLLADARVAWLSAKAPHGFVAAMRRGTKSSLAFLTEREKAFAESHTAFAIDEEGQRNAANLYLEGEGEASKLFWEVMAGEVEGEEKTFVNVDTTLAPLIQEFGFYLEYLPGMKGQQRHDAEAQQLRETKALQLHDAWDKRLYPGMKPTTQDVTFADTMTTAANDGLDYAAATKQENDSASRAESNDGSDAAVAKKQENKNDPRAKRDAAKENASPRPSISDVDRPPLAPRSAAAKPLEFYIRNAALKEAKKQGRNVIISSLRSYCLESIKKKLTSPSPERHMLKAIKMFERHMKYWSLCKAIEKAATDRSFVSAFRLGEAISSVFAIRRTRAFLSSITKSWGGHKVYQGLAVFMSKKGVARFFGPVADTIEIISLAQKDDYDAAYMTAGTMIVTVTLGLLNAPGLVIFAVGAIGAVIAGYWTNSVDEDWLTHSFWGTYYKGAYRLSPYPPFSYKEFFEKLDKMKPASSITEGKDEERAPKTPKTGVEDEARDPKPPEAGVAEHSEQQKQWLSMMSEPTLTHTSFIVDRSGVKETLLHVKYTVRFFDYLQSSIVSQVTLCKYGSSKGEVLALSDKPTDLMPVPFRLFLETVKLSEESKAPPKKGPDAGGTPNLTKHIQTVSLEGVFSVSALRKRAPAVRPLNRHGIDYVPSLFLDMTFNYLPNLAVGKLKSVPYVPLREFVDRAPREEEEKARKRYNELLQSIADE